MSSTKRWMESKIEAKRAEEKESCECYWNFDDKFEVLCEKHRVEREAEADREAWHYLHEIC